MWFGGVSCCGIINVRDASVGVVSLFFIAKIIYGGFEGNTVTVIHKLTL